MAALWLLTLFVIIQPAFQVAESDSFLIYNENLKLCVQLQESSSTIILDYCNTDNERQHFKWVSDNQILNTAVKQCLAVPSKTNQVPVTVSPCNGTIRLQKWECKNKLLALREEQEDKLFLHPEGGHKGKVIVSNASTIKSAWKIYGTKDALCSKGYEELFTIDGNAFGAPCVFPFKYMNKLHTKCIRDDDERGRLWCGTTPDVDRDSLTGFCPVKDIYDGYFWTINHWTGDLYQINTESALTWYEARRSCQQQNAELLSIGELHEQTYLTGLTSSTSAKYWISLNSLDFDNGWEWTDNHPLRYLNWAPGHPSPETAKTCGLMVAKNGKWMNEKCLQKLGYICKKENSSLDATVIPPDGDKPIQCEYGWVAYAGHCYRLNRDFKSWKHALLSCQKDDGNLISIHNIEEYSFVISQLDYKPAEDVLWIGLNDQMTQMYFEWSDRSPVKFTKWKREQPMHINDIQEDCVIMTGENGDWAIHFCDEEHGYICKKERSAFLPEEVTDPNCQKGWKRHGLYCYLIEQTTATFSEATSVCEAKKGFLASVEDRYEQAYLTSLIGLRSENYFWIGLSDVGQPGAFNWTGGDSVAFTHWNAKMPGPQPGCVAMRTGTAAGLWDVVNCEEKAAFLCKQWAEGVTPPPVSTTTPLAPCPEGWHASPTRNVCFKAYMEKQKHKKTWFEAQDFCREIGGDLGSIHNSEEQDILSKQEIRETCWIGLNSLDPTIGWTWSDGSPVDYDHRSHWHYYNSEYNHCYTMHIFGYWLPDPCEQLLPWICQINRGVPVKREPNNTFEHSFKEIEDGWIAFGNNEYYFSNATLPAEKSRAFCKKHGGDLAVIQNETENKFLHRYSVIYGASMQTPYIGMILGLDRKFGWMDGTEVTYTAWAPDEPNFANDDENCVVMYLSTGLWNDLNCGFEKSFICERHNSSVRPSVAPTSPTPQGGCTEGWHLFNNKCFKIVGFNENERKNWSDARADCRSRGGNLASIPSKPVQAFLIMHLNGVPTSTWIGLNDINSEHHFHWTDGNGVYYTNWAKGFPGYYGDCVSMMTRPERLAGNWRDGECDAKKPYICQRNTDTTSSHSETTIPASGYILYGNSSYSLVSPNMTWEDARKKCKSENAELASILTPNIQSFLWLQVLKYGEPVWIGLNSNMTNEAYSWMSNWRLVYTNWAAEEPKQKIACVYLDLDGHWKTGSCNEKHFSVCEKYHGILPTMTPQHLGKCPPLKQNHKTWIPYRAHCYAIYPVWESWSVASMKCAQLGATLTSIEDLAEQSFLMERIEQLSPKNFWIGMFKNIAGEWTWEDNTEVNFVNWQGGQLNDDGVSLEDDFSFNDKCILMNSHTGEWSNSFCSYSSNGFICKTPKIIEVPPATETTHHDANKDNVASAQDKTVMVVFLVIFILIGAGITVYIFYRRRSRRAQTGSGFDNSLYRDNTIILQNDSLSLVDNKAEY